MKRLGFSLIISLLIAVSGCNKDTNAPSELGYTYFPIEVGHWVIYEVDSILHDSALRRHDTAHYEIKELIESEFVDGEGRMAQRVERWRRADSTQGWRLVDAWVFTRTATTAEKVEENNRYVRLAFPINRHQFWDGNSFNNLESWDHYYNSETLHDSKTYNGLTFDSTVTVIQRENFNKVEEEDALEVYAAGVGLVHKRLIDLDLYFQDQAIRKGIEYTQTIKSFGKL